jgi:hypothetical protein
MLIFVILFFAGWSVEELGVVLALIAFVVGPFWLLYLLRITPRNEGVLHGGGFEGADAAFGVLPVDPLNYRPRILPDDDATDCNSNGEVLATADIDI